MTDPATEFEERETLAEQDEATPRARTTVPRPKAARTYIKTSLTEATEDDLLTGYAPIINQMVHRFAPLVRVAVDADDLRNIACMALLQAAHTYDPTQGVAFEIYARMRIRGAILDEIRKQQPLSRTVYSRRRDLERTIEELRIELKRHPSEDEIAARLGISAAQYQQLLDTLRPVIFVPIHQMLEGDDEFGATGHMVEDLNQADPSQLAGQKELQEMIRDRILELPLQHKKVLTLFYYEGLRMKDIAELLGVSESRICQINTEAVLSLRSYLHKKEKI
jgi:RNA polymerase sigma factor for flagellar operon FliA